MADEEDNGLRELRAYNIGYNLGWYRAFESIANDLAEISDAILNSATFREIEREKRDTPIFLAKILDIQAQVAEMRAEHMPILLTERKKINEIANRISKLPTSVFTEGLDAHPSDVIAKLLGNDTQKGKDNE